MIGPVSSNDVILHGGVLWGTRSAGRTLPRRGYLDGSLDNKATNGLAITTAACQDRSPTSSMTPALSQAACRSGLKPR